MEMKKFIHLIIIFFLVCVFHGFSAYCNPIYAKDKDIEAEKVQEIENSIDSLNKKIYASGLFSPSDVDKLVEIKTYLDTKAGTKLVEPVYAKLFYNAGYILKEREYNQDAIQYFKIVTKNFPETIYYQRALGELENFGIKTEEKEEKEEDRY